VLLWLLVLLLLASLLLVVYLVRGPLLSALADWWVVDEPLERSQAIVVLAGDNVMGDRLRHAVELYRQGWAPRVVLSGFSYRSYFNEVEWMQQEAVNLGVPEDHIIAVPQRATSTLAEALALHRVLAEHEFRTIIVVTSNYHTRRSRMIFRALYREQGTQILMSAAPDHEFKPQRWWKDREGRIRFLWEGLATINTWWELLDPPPE
jgi:uncharacterized SAM-binding protein YcdF (DUF218 family)